MIRFTPSQCFIVTGASSGIGESVALLLNELGAGVIAIGRNEERLAALKTKAVHPDEMYLEIKDLAEDIAGLPQYVKSLKDTYGKFQGLAYCAGKALRQPLKIWDVDEAKSYFDINYFAPVSLLKGFCDKRICNPGGACVLISSASALLADKGHCIYAGSKAALSASVRSIAKEYAPYGIRANCILPTVIKTPMTSSRGDYLEEQAAKYPLGVGKPADVANLAAFLLSDRACWITAQNYVVDCGSF